MEQAVGVIFGNTQGQLIPTPQEVAEQEQQQRSPVEQLPEELSQVLATLEIFARKFATELVKSRLL